MSDKRPTLPAPVTNTDVYLSAIAHELYAVSEALATLAEMSRLMKAYAEAPATEEGTVPLRETPTKGARKGNK